MYPGRPNHLGDAADISAVGATACAVASSGTNVLCDVAALKALPGLIKSLFTGSSYDATHQVILQRVSAITADPMLQTVAGQQAWLALRCWAGDQTVITPDDTTYLFGPGYTPAMLAQGCGCEVAHGCRADAQQAVRTLEQQIPTLKTGFLSTSPVTSQGNPYAGATGAPSSSGAPYQQPQTTTQDMTPLLIGGAVLLLILMGGRR